MNRFALFLFLEIALWGALLWYVAERNPKAELTKEIQQADAAVRACPVSMTLGSDVRFDWRHPLDGARAQITVAFSPDGGLEKTEWRIEDVRIRRSEAELDASSPLLRQAARAQGKVPAWRAEHGQRFTMIEHGVVYEATLNGDVFATLVQRADTKSSMRRLRVLFPGEIAMRVTIPDGRVGEGRWSFPNLATGWIDHNLCDLAPLLRLREVILKLAAQAQPPVQK